MLPLLIILLVITTNGPLYGQLPLPGRAVVTQWGMDDGLPQSSVNDIIQTRDGYIWLATFGGLVRFDGVNFTVFDRSNTPGMLSDRILGLLEDRNGALWLKTERGFLRFTDTGVTPYFFEAASQIFSPHLLRIDDEGNLWVTAVEHAFYYDQEEGFIRARIRVDSASVQSAIRDTSGVWLTISRDVYKTLGKDIVRMGDVREYMRYELMDVREHPAGSGTYFLAGSRDGVLRVQDGEVRQYLETEGLPSSYTRFFYIDRDNRLWITGFRGVAYRDGDRFIQLDIPELTGDFEITGMLHDAEGNYWFSTSGNGFFRVRRALIEAITLQDGLTNDIMLSMTTLQDGTRLYATNCGGVFTDRDGQIRPAGVNEHLPNLCIWSVLQRRDGSIWMGSRGLYTTTSPDLPGTFFPPSDEFQCNEVFALYEDRFDTLWIGCQNGLYSYTDAQGFTSYTTRDGLSYNDTRTLFEDREGRLWVGTTQGLNLKTESGFQQVELMGGMAGAGSSEEPYVRAIHQDDEGVLWVGTYGSGLFRREDDRLTRYTRAEGLFDNVISHIVEDDAGNFWMGSNRGISRIQRQNLNDFAYGLTGEVAAYSYGVGEGMPSPETNGGFQPSTLTDADGRIYFPTVEGVAVVNAREVNYNPLPPPVYLEEFRTGRTVLPLSEGIRLPHDNAYIQINYTALSFQDASKICFRYTLDGFDQDWFEVGNNRTALYTRIPPGTYRFRVQASNNDGVWNNEGASVAITVVPPFWGTPWFRGLLGLMAVGLISGAYYYRVNRLEAENERQRRFSEKLIASQEQERSRIASELHDGLGQQVLVIKNHAELIRMRRESDIALTKELGEIAENAQRVISEARNIAHNLRPVHLEKFGLTEALYALMAEVDRTSQLQWEFLVPELTGVLPVEHEINFYRVIQEAITNIQKHAGAENAGVIIRRADAAIRVQIFDDGIGFDQNQARNAAGMGFTGMLERIELMGGNVQIRSTPFEGTEITIEIAENSHAAAKR